MTESEHRVLAYGQESIVYELRYAERKTLSISVHPDLRVAVAAPVGTTVEEIEAHLRQRAAWIRRQQRRYETYLPHLPPRQYVSGETHRYLGRPYRLKVLAGDTEGVELTRSMLYVRLGDPKDTARVHDLLDAWYLAQARTVFAERLAACYPRVERLSAPYPELQIRTMSSRWGSAGPAGRITLNIKLIQVPKAHIDYVMLHELCHLVEPNHSPAYYRLLDRVLPDWRARREALNALEFG